MIPRLDRQAQVYCNLCGERVNAGLLYSRRMNLGLGYIVLQVCAECFTNEPVDEEWTW